MNPHPFSELKNFTVPVAIAGTPFAHWGSASTLRTALPCPSLMAADISGGPSTVEVDELAALVGGFGIGFQRDAERRGDQRPDHEEHHRQSDDENEDDDERAEVHAV